MAQITFEGKVAVVTGGGRGLGREYALELAKRGASLVVNDFGGETDGTGSDREPADQVVREIQEMGGKAVANHDSIVSAEAGERLIKTAVDSFGTVDILINNAGALRDRSFIKTSEEDWDMIYEINTKGSYNVTRPAVAVMREKGYGRIVFTTSGTGLYGNFGQANYAAAKMGLVGLMNVLKLETAKYNIMCNTIAPIADTRLTKGLLSPDTAEYYRREHVAALVLYLVSSENTTTGCIYNCAAGWYSRSEMVCSPGVVLANGKEPVSVEEIMKNWDRINNMEGAKFLNNLAESFAMFSDALKKN